jgi:predicted O-methyltransferase YrrM
MSRYDDRRAQALEDATNGVSKAILEAMPRMVAHPVPIQGIPHPGDGSPGVCVQDVDIGGAIGCTAREGLILGKAASVGRPKNMLEIGSYVGWSSAHLLYGNRLRLVCVDSLNEGAGQILTAPNVDVLRRFHQNMRALNMSDRVVFIPAESPECLPEISPDGGWDFVFLDGWHLNEQPLRDVKGLLPHMNENGVIFLHDMGMPDVNEAGKHLVSQGWVFTGFITPNFLAAFWKTEPKWWNRFLGSID